MCVVFALCFWSDKAKVIDERNSTLSDEKRRMEKKNCRLLPHKSESQRETIIISSSSWRKVVVVVVVEMA